MANKLASQVSLPFAAGEDGLENTTPNIQITGHPGVAWVDGGIPLRVYPPGCTYQTSAGTVKPDTIRQVEVPGALLQFSGNEASLDFYPDTAPTVELVFGFDPKGKPISGVTFTVQRKLGKIIANKEFRGLVKVGSYLTQYQLIWYYPTLELQDILGSQFAAVHVEYGTIAAYKDGGLTLYNVQLPTVTPGGSDKMELWRVTSKTVIDPSGEWEYPPNWTSTYAGTYPDGKTGPDKDLSVVKERVHEIGYITRTGGNTWYDQFAMALRSPYSPKLILSSGTPDFQPEIGVSYQDPATLFPTDIGARRAAADAIAARKTIPLIRR